MTAVNQCDGCRAGHPLVDGVHKPVGSQPWDGSAMVCTADRYGLGPFEGCGATTDEARVTDEELAASIAWSRKWLHTAGLEPISYRMYSTIVALADRLAARDAEIAEVLDFFGSFDLLCRVVPVGAIKSRCGACQRCLSAAFLSKHGRRTP